MPAFLVRLIANRDIVGFFCAEDRDRLVFVVDECADVGACEFIELPAGGIMWRSPAVAVPMNPGDPDDPESTIPDLPWARVGLSEAWWSVLYGYTDDNWTKFVNIRKPKHEPSELAKPMGPGRVIPMRRRSIP
jgi:hypothetical protein